MKKTIIENLFPIINVFSVIVSLLLLFRQMYTEEPGRGGVSIGNVTYSLKHAQRKRDGQTIYYDLERTVPVFRGDTIRTARDSEAEITFQDGTRLRIDQVSMVILNSEKQNINVELKSGSLRAMRQDSAGSSGSLRIESQGTSVQVQEGDIGLAAQNGGELTLNVNTGRAVLTGRSDNESGTTMQEGSVAHVTARGTQVAVQRLIPVAPLDGARLIAHEDSAEITFRWENHDNNAVLFEISRFNQFNSIYTQRVVREAGLNLALESGTYFWRVSAAGDKSGGPELSKAMKFTVIANPAPRLFSPDNGALIQSPDASALVDFSWSSNPLAAAYEVVIARDPEFKQVLQRIECASSSVTLPIEQGRYYWRVSTSATEPGAGMTSQSQLFVLEKKAAAPVLVRPIGNEPITQALLADEGALFIWRQGSNRGASILRISRQSSLTDTVLDRPVEGNSFNFKQVLPPGRYYWSVSANTAGVRSEPASFLVVSTEKPVLLEPESEIHILEGMPRQFAWKGQTPGSAYRLMISHDRSFSNLAAERTASRERVVVNDLSPGHYFWQVQELSRQGRVLVTSESRGLVVETVELPLIAVPVFPRDEETIDIGQTGSLKFRWVRTAGARSYTVRIISTQGNPIHTFTTERTEYEIKDLKRFYPGEFLWTLTALDDRRQGSPVTNRFRIIYERKLGAPVINSPEEQYVPQ